MKFSSLLLISTVAWSAGAPADDTATDRANPSIAQERKALREAAKLFCTEVRREAIRGLPTNEQLQRLSPFITPELRSILEQACVYQDMQIRQHPDEKPAWIEGDLFSSLFEGVTSWEVGDVFGAPSVDSWAKVKQTYGEPGQKPETWTDTLLFKQREGRLLVDDIRMGGNWDFANGPSLRGGLPGGVKEGDDHTSFDERWKVSITRDGDSVKRVTIKSADKGAKEFNLYGDSSDKPCPMPVWVVWSPDCQMLAMRLGDEPKFSRLRVFRLSSSGWSAVTIPVLHPEEKKTISENGFKETDSLMDANHWQDAKTLVVKYFASYTNGDDSDGYHQFVSVRFGDDGKAVVTSATDVPGDD